jgi:subtilase family serine protease
VFWSHLPIRLASVFSLAVLSLLSTTAAAQTHETSVIEGNHSPSVARMITPQDAPPDKALQMRAVLKLNHADELARLLISQQDPESPLYHRWLPTGEFDRRFAPSIAERAQVAHWLTQVGFQVADRISSPRIIEFSGTVAQVARAFSLKIVSSDAGAHFGNTTDPAIPAALTDAIGFIDGLDNLRGAPSSVRQMTAKPAVAISLPPWIPAAHQRPDLAAFVNGGPADNIGMPSFIRNGSVGFGPADMQTFYNETPLLSAGVDGSGAGGCVGLAEVSDYDDLWFTNFASVFDLPTNNVTRIFPDGANPGRNARDSETIFDIEWARAMAPGAPLNVYIATPNGTFGFLSGTATALQRAVHDNTCVALSASIESCGEPKDFFTQMLGPIYAQGATQGQTIFIAAGDEGAAEFDYDPKTGACVNGTSRHVNELASDPNITSVGGTQFVPHYDSSFNDIGFAPEAVWNEPELDSSGVAASGGGASVFFVKPYYQNGLTPNDDARDQPDIAIEAACEHPGVFSVFPPSSEVTCCGCGTSLGAPIWAAITSLLDQHEGHRIGALNPALYQLGALANTPTTGIRDVTVGNNDFGEVVGFEAVAGYDQATGWGTPDITQFVTNFAKAPVPGRVHVPRNLKFAKVRTGKTRTMKFHLRNQSRGRLHGTIAALAAPFRVLSGSGTFVLGPGESVQVRVAFQPAASGRFAELLRILSDDPRNPAVNVNLTGKGK